MASTDYTTYGILAGNGAIAYSGQTSVIGNVGSNIPIGGVGTITASGAIYIGSISTALSNAQNDYNTFISQSPSTIIATQEIGGRTYGPGVIQVTFAGAKISSSITLNGSGSYFFQIINGGLTVDATAGNINFTVFNGAIPSEVFWLVNGDVIFNDGGNSINFPGITMTSQNITVDSNDISNGGLIAFGSGSNISVNNNLVRSLADEVNYDKQVNSYITLNSTIADQNAIRILATNAAGGMNISAGSGGITATTTDALNLAGNSIVQRWNTTGSLIHIQPTPAEYDTASTIVASDLLIRLIKSNPSGPITLTMPSASALITAISAVSGVAGSLVNDAFDFSLINNSSFNVTLATTTYYGNLLVSPSSSGLFRIQLTGGASPTGYTLYRVV